MALRDYFDITVRPDTKHRVDVTRSGGNVVLDMNEGQQGTPGKPGKPASQFITVMELNSAEDPIRTFHFAKSEVIAIEQGNQPPPKAKK